VEDSELSQLREKLQATEQELNEGYSQAISWGWELVGMKERPLPTGYIAALYVLFNFAALVAGVVCTILGNGLDSLGVALVVGSIFGFGAFIAQFWTVAAQREYDTYNQVTGRLGQLRDLNANRIALLGHIQRLETGLKEEQPTSPEGR
jgi:hypothetical protein